MDSQVSIGVEAVIRPMAEDQCIPGLQPGSIPPDCIYSVPVTVEPYGTFYKWDERFWYPLQPRVKGRNEKHRYTMIKVGCPSTFGTLHPLVMRSLALSHSI